jgi:hypothetical protein
MAYPGARLLGLEQIRARSGDDRADPAFPPHPGVLHGPGDLRGDDDGGVREAELRCVLSGKMSAAGAMPVGSA